MDRCPTRTETHETEDRTEAELIRGLQEGRAEAFEAFNRTIGPRIYDALCWLCGNQTTAEDLAQETVVAVYRGIGKFRGESSLYSWVYRIALRMAARERHRRHSGRVTLDSADRVPAGEDLGALAEEELRRDQIREALATLPAEQRESVVLHCLEGLTQAETASAVQRPLGTVKWQIAQGLHSLRATLTQGGYSTHEM